MLYFNSNLSSINASNEKYFNNNYDGSFSTLNTFYSAKKSYTNNDNNNISNLKDSILPFDDDILKKKLLKD